jgi:hypothetical protein
MRRTFPIAAFLMLFVSLPAFTQEWIEFASREERFTCVFPTQPKITETTWLSEYGTVLPARVYSATEGQSRYSLTVVDYNPLERLAVEKSKSCPAGAEPCQGIADVGLGYWKNDMRGAIVYATSKFLQRNARITSLIWNFQQMVQGQELQLTNADQSVTGASIYMHDNKLIIMEGTVPKGYPLPEFFTQSLGWLDEKGNGIRYLTIYVNAPDVAKPAFRILAPPPPRNQ